MHRPRLLIAAAVALALAGCGKSDATGPVAGLLTVTLSTSTPNTGALMFTVSGGQIDGVNAAGYQTYQTTLSTSSRRIILTGNIAAGTVVQLQVPDIAKASNYTARVEQAADRTTYQPLTGGYSLTIGSQ